MNRILNLIGVCGSSNLKMKIILEEEFLKKIEEVYLVYLVVFIKIF